MNERGINDPSCISCFSPLRDPNRCSECDWAREVDRAFDDELPLGTVLRERYRIGRVLGRGGFGITYLGFDERLRRRRALKEYFPRGILSRGSSGTRVTVYSGQKELYERGLEAYLSEAQLLAQFEHHSCIVSPLDFFEENATAYLVMEYLEGETLRLYVERNGGRLPFAHALYFMNPVLDALKAVHAAGITHRDVSPDNIFLTTQSQSKLIDFGAARHGLAARAGPATVIVRDHYAPPEQYAREGRQGPWTDIYAAAATLYYALTGTSPPPGPERLLRDELLPPSALGVPLPRLAEDAIMAALALRPEDRPQRVELLREGLLRGQVGSAEEQTRITGTSVAGATPASFAEEPSQHAAAPHAAVPSGIRARASERWIQAAGALHGALQKVGAASTAGAARLSAWWRLSLARVLLTWRAASRGTAAGLRAAAAWVGLATSRAWTAVMSGITGSMRRISMVGSGGLAVVLGIALTAGIAWWLTRGTDSDPLVLETGARAAVPAEGSFDVAAAPSLDRRLDDDTQTGATPRRLEPVTGVEPSAEVGAATPDGAAGTVGAATAAAPSPRAGAAEVESSSASGNALLDGSAATAVGTAASELDVVAAVEPTAAIESTTVAAPVVPSGASTLEAARDRSDSEGESLGDPRNESLTPETVALTVRSNVSGDRLEIDGEPMGSTGPTAHALSPGTHTITVSKPGWISQTRTLEITRGAAPEELRFRLVRERSPAADLFATALTELESDDAEVRQRATVRLREVAASGHAPAQEHLGLLYVRGDYVTTAEADRDPESDTEALRWYRMAAEAGSASAQLALARRLEYGRWNPEQALEQRASKSALERLFSLIDPFSSSESTEQRAGAFIDQLEKNVGNEYGGPFVLFEGAEKDDAAAQRSSPRFQEALRWYRAAGNQGNAVAQERAGFMEAGGRGTPRNVIVAFRQWFMKAAQNGRKDAQYVVGMCYSLGIGIPATPENRKAGECWLRKAAAQGQPAAKQALESLSEEIARQPAPRQCPVARPL